jgi:hypothetical protein
MAEDWRTRWGCRWRSTPSATGERKSCSTCSPTWRRAGSPPDRHFPHRARQHLRPVDYGRFKELNVNSRRCSAVPRHRLDGRWAVSASARQALRDRATPSSRWPTPGARHSVQLRLAGGTARRSWVWTAGDPPRSTARSPAAGSRSNRSRSRKPSGISPPSRQRHRQTPIKG